VQPLQARNNPLWMYVGEEDVDRVSKDLTVKDLEKLVRRFSSLSKKDKVPTSCRVEPYSGSHALPKVSNLFLRVVLLLFRLLYCFLVSLYLFVAYSIEPSTSFFSSSPS
jgi:hypothetical protein